MGQEIMIEIYNKNSLRDLLLGFSFGFIIVSLWILSRHDKNHVEYSNAFYASFEVKKYLMYYNIREYDTRNMIEFMYPDGAMPNGIKTNLAGEMVDKFNSAFSVWYAENMVGVLSESSSSMIMMERFSKEPSIICLGNK